MGEEIFRKKNLEKMKSPDSIDDYIHVSNPGVWLLLVSIIALLAGACVWGTFGYIDITKDAVVLAEKGSVFCTIEDKDVTSVQIGMTVKFEGHEAVITNIIREGEEFVCSLSPDSSVADGFYDGHVVVNTIRPLSFLVDGN